MSLFSTLKRLLWPSSRSFHERMETVELQLKQQLRLLQQGQEQQDKRFHSIRQDLQDIQQYLQETRHHQLQELNDTRCGLRELQCQLEEIQVVSQDVKLLLQQQTQEQLILMQQQSLQIEAIGQKLQMSVEKSLLSEQQMHQVLENFKWIEERELINNRNLLREIRSSFFNLNFELERRFGTNSGDTSIIYNDSFYLNNRYGSVISGLHVLKPLVALIEINSVVDFGCGTGTWLYAAKRLGVREVLGIDGDYVNRSLLMISQGEFKPFDLEKPLRLKKRYDMAMSLEVAEHMHEDTADMFISELCDASDIILFSAAHPGQGGDNHINEQPFEYWRDKFVAQGYGHIEVRMLFRDNWEIEEWYRANLALYVNGTRFDEINLNLLELYDKVD